MKKIFTLLLLFAGSLTVLGQNQLFSGQPKDSVVRMNTQSQQFDYVPGVLLVKFRDGTHITFKKSRKGLKSSQAFMNRLINKYGIVDGERLFPNEKRLKSVQILTAPNGNKFVRPSLNNIYKLKLKSDDPRQLFESISSLKADSAHVVYAEPDYIYSIVGDKADSPVMTEKQAEHWIRLHPEIKLKQAAKANTLTPNDPLYSQQWGIPATQVNQVWDSTTGDTTQIIGILDTGVDWKHPDLKANIWKNPDPNTVPDANGVVDDVRGWDFVNHDNDPSDDNSHGTHVAGIAAAVGNNGIGIAGVDWHAKIMPVKVFQSDGRGDVATITKGIIYAATHGATVINMSFGSYARSLTMEAALENAYASSVLVAAAGNDDVSINRLIPPGPFYPASLSYVIGIQATQQPVNKSLGFKNNTHLSDYTNYDNDGPIFSRYSSLLNYEMRAPGSGIISTIPNGNYRIYSGTSMSTPFVSGCVALYMQLKPRQSQELMWGNLINTTRSNLQIFNALNIKAKPQLWFVSKTIVDTLAGDNNNGLVDAGETIQLWFKVRNTWGQSDSVSVGLRFGEFEDTTTAQILKDTAFIGSISPYASRTNERTPLLVHISPSVTNDRAIVFESLLWSAGSTDTIKQQIVLTVNHGEYLSGVMDSTLVLTPDKFWIVHGSFRIGANGNLIIKPGTKVKFYNEVINRGNFEALGTRDSMVIMEGPKTIGGEYGGNGRGIYNYTKFINNTTSINAKEVKNSIVYGFQSGEHMFSASLVENTVIQNSSVSFFGSGTYLKNNFYNCYHQAWYHNGGKWLNNNLVKIVANDNYNSSFFYPFTSDPVNIRNNYIMNDPYLRVCEASGLKEVINFPSQYWGTTDSAIIRGKYYDFWTSANDPYLNIKPILTEPLDSAHGIVWKVLVDGIDPQDQAKLMNPIGVGPHRFDVYFNRPMDTAYTPHLSFGVRVPYNQQAVTDSGHWSHNNRVWTVYKTIKLYTGDGINRIRVADARDPEGFAIPVENMRFQFLISAAESSSLDFMATPGLGKVKLEWNNSGLIDLLGFNMYRMKQINDSTLSSPVLINKSLILDTLYTDYKVIPNKKYFYFYKVVNTDFSESDSSHVVAATPFTAALGDANGDLKVNVLDLTTIVAYILGKNPQPFIKAAADINADSTINVLDIIGIVKLILGTKTTAAENVRATTTPTIALKDSTIQLTSDHRLAALQFELKGRNLENIQLTSMVKDFEFSYAVVNGKLLGIMYSFTGALIPGGVQNIIKVTHATGQLKWGDVFGSDIMGKYVTVKVETITGIHNTPQLLKTGIEVRPNPSHNTLTLSYRLATNARVRIEIYNINGQRVKTLQNGVQSSGKYELTWNGKNGKNRLLPSGVYLCKMVVIPLDGGTAFKKEIKIVRINER